MTFLSKIYWTALVISLVVTPAIGQERLFTSPDRTSERLVVRDPAGRVQFYVERTLMGRLVIREPDGSVLGHMTEPREETPPPEPRKYLTLPWDDE